MKKKAKTYTVVIIPDRNGGKTLSLNLSRSSIILMIALICMLAGAAAFLLVKSAEAAKKLQYFNALRKDNEFLTKENSELRLVYQRAARIDSLAAYLERMSALSMAPEKTRTNIKTNGPKKRGKEIDTTKAVEADNAAYEKTGITTEHESGAEQSKNTEDANTSIPSVLPVEGWITQHFVDDTSKGVVAHPGIDIAAAEGMSIKAPAAGVVLTVGTDQYYGNLIVIKHSEEFTTRYGHCAKIIISEGEKVERGQTIALVGNTGRSTAPHLHYEVIRNGKNENPLVYSHSKK
ncbi:MAG: M23 family metallopeptidase [Chitinispirillaceae bacterium]|nr:M23 family metallopeptidase [Chitinispirillaceae bacterium]